MDDKNILHRKVSLPKPIVLSIAICGSAVLCFELIKTFSSSVPNSQPNSLLLLLVGLAMNITAYFLSPKDKEVWFFISIGFVALILFFTIGVLYNFSKISG